jgi:hypothetical protein
VRGEVRLRDLVSAFAFAFAVAAVFVFVLCPLSFGLWPLAFGLWPLLSFVLCCPLLSFALCLLSFVLVLCLLSLVSCLLSLVFASFPPEQSLLKASSVSPVLYCRYPLSEVLHTLDLSVPLKDLHFQEKTGSSGKAYCGTLSCLLL